MRRCLHVCLFSLFVFLSLSVLSKPAHARLTANPNSINFGNQVVGSGGASFPVTLSNTDFSRSFTIVSIHSSDNDFSVAGASLPAVLLPGQSLTVNVAFTPSSPQSHSGTVGFTTYYGWTINVPLSGVGMESQSGNQLSVDPPALHFGSVSPGSTATQLIKLSNPTGSTIAVNTLKISGRNISVLGFSPGMSVQPGQTLVLTLDFSPSTPENAKGRLLFFTDAANRPIAVGWSGEGTQPSPAPTNRAPISVSPASLNFGTVNIGSGNAQSFTITNNESTPVTLVNIWAVGPEMVLGGWIAGSVIEPGQSLTATATFSPQSVEDIYGTISVVTDATSVVQIPWAADSSQPQIASTASVQPQTPSTTATQPQTSSTTATQPRTPAATAALNPSVSLLWNPSTSSGVIGYNVYRGSVSGGPYNLVTPSMMTATGYVDALVSSGQTYYYVVTSLASGAEESAFSPEVVAAVP
jgi:hypothetical protein